MKNLGAGLLLVVAALCLYGFVASFEPGPRAIYFRAGYLVIGLLAVVASASLLLKRRD